MVKPKPPKLLIWVRVPVLAFWECASRTFPFTPACLSRPQTLEKTILCMSLLRRPTVFSETPSSYVCSASSLYSYTQTLADTPPDA